MKLLAHSLIAVFLFSGLCADSDAAETVPKLINYQGKLTDAAGGNLGAGQYTLRFKLFDAAAEGTLVWGEERGVTVVGGVFNVILGGAGANPVAGAAVNNLAFAFGGAERFLETTIVSGPGVAAEHVLAPRQQLMSVPFAVKAEAAGNAQNSENLNGKPGSVWMPPGGMIAYGGAADPDGWLICDGRALGRTGTYAGLFAAIGTAYGTGDGSTTFNIPDSRGLVLRASGTQNLNGRAKVGPALGAKQEDEFQGHKHFFSYGGDPSIIGIQGSTGGGSFNVTWQQANNANPNLLEVGLPRNDGANGAPRTGAETRVASLGVNYIIKY